MGPGRPARRSRGRVKAAGVSGVVVDAAHVTTLGSIEDFRIDWQWVPAWRPADITDDGREQLRAIGFTPADRQTRRLRGVMPVPRPGHARVRSDYRSVPWQGALHIPTTDGLTAAADGFASPAVRTVRAGLLAALRI